MYRLAGLCKWMLIALLGAAAVATVCLRNTSPITCLGVTIGLWYLLTVVIFYRAFARDRLAATSERPGNETRGTRTSP